MFWNATTCQKRKIFAGRSTKNDKMALVSDTALCSKLAQGPFFFAFWAKPRGRMTQENDTTTELQLWLSGAWGRSLPTSFVQFGPDCIACYAYLKFDIILVMPNQILSQILTGKA